MMRAFGLKRVDRIDWAAGEAIQEALLGDELAEDEIVDDFDELAAFDAEGSESLGSTSGIGFGTGSSKKRSGSRKPSSKPSSGATQSAPSKPKPTTKKRKRRRPRNADKYNDFDLLDLDDAAPDATATPAPPFKARSQT